MTFSAYPKPDKANITHGPKLRRHQHNATTTMPEAAIEALETVGIAPTKKLVTAVTDQRQRRSALLRPPAHTQMPDGLTRDEKIDWEINAPERARIAEIRQRGEADQLYTDAADLHREFTTKGPGWIARIAQDLDSALKTAHELNTNPDSGLGDTLEAAHNAATAWNTAHTAAAKLRTLHFAPSIDRANLIDYQFARPDNVHRWLLDNAKHVRLVDRHQIQADLDRELQIIWETVTEGDRTPPFQAILANYDDWGPGLYTPEQIIGHWQTIDTHETAMSNKLAAAARR